MDNFIFSLNAILPVFMVIAAGVFLKRIKLINNNFVSVASKLVFNLTLPAFLFRGIVQTDFYAVFKPEMVFYMFFSTLLLCIIGYIITSIFIKTPGTRGAFAQGMFRTNYALLAMPLILNLFGQEALNKAAVASAFLMPLYNILGVLILTINSCSQPNIKRIGLGILKNPLIWAVLLGIPFSLLKIDLPLSITKTLDYFADTAIPLALLCIGGQLSFASLKNNIKLGLTATTVKIVVAPLLFTTLAYFIGFRGDELGIILVTFGSPTAVSSYVMASGMNCNPKLAGEIVLLTTVGSAFTIFAGVLLLKTLALI